MYVHTLKYSRNNLELDANWKPQQTAAILRYHGNRPRIVCTWNINNLAVVYKYITKLGSGRQCLWQMSADAIRKIK
jgi:hypothetical protein